MNFSMISTTNRHRHRLMELRHTATIDSSKPIAVIEKVLNERRFSSRPISQDELIEFTENDCTAPKVRRPPTKAKRKVTKKQTTMYDYASSVSYRHRQFYSSLDNTVTTKTIVKGDKRPLTVGPVGVTMDLALLSP